MTALLLKKDITSANLVYQCAKVKLQNSNIQKKRLTCDDTSKM